MIHQDARIYAGLFDGAEEAKLGVEPGRRIYVHLARGQLYANGIALEAGDALKITEEAQLDIGQGREAEVLVFDLPGA
jgi:redox-sensitive bicupin YhaK (pirin superfamily)